MADRTAQREPLTDAQSRVLDFVRAFISDKKRPPTIREVSEAMGFTSTNAASDHLKRLKRKGYIEMDPKVARGIRLLVEVA